MTVPGPIASATASLFRGLSAVRGRRVFHPHGVGFDATLTPYEGVERGATLIASRRSRRAVVRLSRAVGLPEQLPDVLGLGVRVPDAYGAGRHQDLLLATSSPPALGRHLLVPARGFEARIYSSLLPYRVGGRLVLVGARPLDGQRSGPGLSALRREATAGLRFEIALAPLWGSWRGVGMLELGRRLPDGDVEALRLDPSNTGGGIELAGFLNQLRRPAYRGSQEGRGAPVRDHSPRVAANGKSAPSSESIGAGRANTSSHV